MTNAVNKKGVNMSMKIKLSNDEVVYISVAINCKKFRTKTGEDGSDRGFICTARKPKAKCKTCSLNKWK